MEANWKPLEARVWRARCAGFMFMGRVDRINLYTLKPDHPRSSVFAGGTRAEQAVISKDSAARTPSAATQRTFLAG